MNLDEYKAYVIATRLASKAEALSVLTAKMLTQAEGLSALTATMSNTTTTKEGATNGN